LLAWESTVVVLATTYHAGRIGAFIGTNDWGNVLGWTTPAACTRLGYYSA
jgi:hypothetical protein